MLRDCWRVKSPAIPSTARSLAFLLAATPLSGFTQAPDTAQALEPVTVTATRTAVTGFDTPASIDLVMAPGLGLGASLSEWLQGVPGLTARERQNYAQDTQISIRGFGARSPFGIRGVRLYVDGVPATQPDGQGQISQFNLATADRVEVLRGPFSALYGNASGGVIQLFTADAASTPKAELEAVRGSFGDQRYSGVASGDGAHVGLSHFETDGYRAHSAAQRTSFNGKLDLKAGEGGRLSLLLNHLDAPDAQDPLGLTRAQLDADPRAAAPAAVQFNTRKSAAQTQLAAVFDQDFGASQSLRLMAYGGRREVEQYLAIPQATQANPRHAGGVVDLGSSFGGGDARWTLERESLTIVAGLTADRLRQHRRGYENFAAGTLGVQGALRRDEINAVTSFDQYLQVDAALSARFSLLAGLRHSAVRFDSRDRYVRAGNPDDSGAVDYDALTPVAGLLFKQNERLHWYGSYGTGFETPTIAELAYRPDGAAGLNFALDPARTRNAEAGVKLRLAPATRLNLAVFRVDARDELVTASNSGGRATFVNAARTRRQGVELAVQVRPSSALELSMAYTLLEARVRSAYRTCVSLPCASAQVEVPRGSRLPGVAESQWFSRAAWSPTAAWQLAAEFRSVDAVPVNDINSESAPSYGVVDAEISHRWVQSGVRALLRLDNLLDEQYAGSVIVNDANGRYYEPARGRSLFAALELKI